MSEWAPLVHGRTAYVDFRSHFIVLPEDFDAADLTWAKRYVLATTQAPDTLPRHPRWCVFRNETRTVVGVTCMAKDVSTTHYREVKQTAEGPRLGHRRLYVFLGLVCNDPEARLPPMEIDLFSDLYQYVIDRWEEKEYESRGLHPMPYRHALPTLPTGDELPVELNTQEGCVALWPCEENEQLWRAANAASGSVAINLPSAGAALNSPFQDTTVAGAHERRVEARAESREPRRATPAGDPVHPPRPTVDTPSHEWNASQRRPPRTGRRRASRRRRSPDISGGLIAVVLWVPRTAVSCLGAMFQFAEDLASGGFRRSEENPSVHSHGSARHDPPPPPTEPPAGDRDWMSTAELDAPEKPAAQGMATEQNRAPSRGSRPSEAAGPRGEPTPPPPPPPGRSKAAGAPPQGFRRSAPSDPKPAELPEPEDVWGWKDK